MKTSLSFQRLTIVSGRPNYPTGDSLPTPNLDHGKFNLKSY